MASRDLAILLRGLVAELSDAKEFRSIVDRQHTKYIFSVKKVLEQLKIQIESPTKADPRGRTLTDDQINKLNTAVTLYVEEVRTELNRIISNRGAKGTKDTFDISMSEPTPGTFVVDLVQKGDKSLFRVLQDAHTKPRANLVNRVNEALGFQAVDSSNLLDLGHSGKAVVKAQEEIQIGKFARNFSAKQEAFKEYIIEQEMEIVSKFLGDTKFFQIGVDTIVLEPEASTVNRSKATLEKAELQSMKKKFEDWLKRGGENGSRWYNQQGSDSALQYARKKILKKAAEVKFKTSEDISLDKRSGSAKTKKRTKVRVGVKTQEIPLSPVNISSGENVGRSMLTIKSLLQASLMEEIRPLMTSPRLNYRTGRLAESFRITEVIQTPQGYPSIGFTYMRDPYDIFDPVLGKAPWNTSGLRGPRELGETAIRSAARKIALNRFYVRRD